MKRDYGFSLIEILVVLVIMGLLISVGGSYCPSTVQTMREFRKSEQILNPLKRR